MIILITGQPGNGKTLRAMALMLEEYERNAEAVKQGKEESRRFFSNVAGSTTAENQDAFPWVEAMPDHNDWTQLPHGAYVLLDEAHADGKTPGLERYGHLFPSTGRPGESDDMRIRAMSTHRHGGYDLVLMTQWPTKLHHQLRTLVGKHIHMNRAMGLQRAGVLTWTRTQVDPYDERQREKAEEEIWVYPKDLYGRYKSATLHTATYKFKVPRKIWGALSMLLVALLVGWGLWLFVFKPDAAASVSSEDTLEGSAALGQAPLGAAGPPRTSDDGEVRWLSSTDYAEDHLPRFATMPWTAPVFDQRQVTVDPLLLCMSGEGGVDANGEWREAGCTCLTEQGTQYDIGQGECRRVARRGMPYNPYRAQAQSQQMYQQVPQHVEAPRLVSAPVVGGGMVGTAPRPDLDPSFGTMTRPALK
ncbi:zonular occludens toxin domain-containing protein [Luteimonas suaedae]|uniref:zonular occludens toxin domain-containing protein n=1 Tax=Luteimonas suaedae TaxID=2605430 RepID=UPI0011EE352E|nr:zonular occludens toxin domain-containing protein [Luteimonas suaedae]